MTKSSPAESFERTRVPFATSVYVLKIAESHRESRLPHFMPAKLSLMRHSLRILCRCKCKLVSQNTRYYFGRVDRAGKIEL